MFAMSATIEKAQKVSLVALLACGVAFLSGCGASGNRTNVELIQDMFESPALKAQDFMPWDREQSSQLLPPPGTVARGELPYPYANDPMEAENKLKNPVSGDLSEEVLRRGQKRYEIACAVCHGVKGQGDGQVAPKMALKPPSLVSDKVRNFKDGRIFHIITAGQGVMGSYASQITNEKDRWAIVNYIRSMQNKTTKNESGG